MPVYLGREESLPVIDAYISRQWDEFENTLSKLMKPGWDLSSRLVGENEKGKTRILNKRWFRWGIDCTKIRNRYRCPLCGRPSSIKPGGLVECMNKKCRNYHVEEKEIQPLNRIDSRRIQDENPRDPRVD